MVYAGPKYVPIGAVPCVDRRAVFRHLKGARTAAAAIQRTTTSSTTKCVVL